MRKHSLHVNIANPDGQYQKIGSVMFAVGVTLSILGEFELIAMSLELPMIIVPRYTPENMAVFPAVLYLILGNAIMLIEYQFFRKTRQNHKSDSIDEHEIYEL